jgi:stage III sporulation protein AE
MFFFQPRGALATAELPENFSPILSQQLESLQLEQLEGYLEQIDRDLQGQVSQFSMRGFFEAIRSGELNVNLGDIFKTLLNYFFREFFTHTSFLGKLLVLGAILGILRHLQSAFEETTVAKLAHGIGLLALLTFALTSFSLALQSGKEAITNMVGFMHALLPVLLTLMAALGNVVSVSLLHPIILISLNLLGALMGNIVFPLIFFAAVLGIVSQLSDHFQVSRLAGLFRDSSVILLGLFLTLFIGILGIQGVAGAVTDGIGLRTAKFLTGTFVPVVGKIMADAVDAVAGCSLFLKNAVGIVGALGILLLCCFPVLKILSIAVVYRLAAAMMQPLGTEKLAECLELLGNYLLVVFAVVAAVGLMFFITLTIVVGFGNMVVMLR